MCLSINNTFHKKEKSLVAEQNILVYKVLERYVGKEYNNKYHTPYQGKRINFNPNDGMYFYKNTRIKKELFGSDGRKQKLITNGIHSFTDKQVAVNEVVMYSNNSTYRQSMHYAIIPKGSNFYIGIDGDIVSTNLVVFRTKKDYLKGKKLFGKISELGLYLMDFWYEDCKSK